MRHRLAIRSADATILALGALVLAIATAHGWYRWVKTGE